MTRRLTALLMARLLALAGGGAAYAESTEILQVLYTGELNHNTNVRESPSSSAKRLGSLKEGDAIEILEIGDDWFTILWEGEAAYVTAGNVDKVQAARPGVVVPDKYYYEEFFEVYTAQVKSDLSMRKTPSSDSQMIATVYEDEEVIVGSVGENWAHVKKGDVTGYVLSEYLYRYRAIDPYMGMIPGAVWYPYAATALGDVAIYSTEDPTQVLTTIPEGSIVCVREPDETGAMLLPYMRTTGRIEGGARVALEPVLTWDEAQPGDLIGVFATFFDAADDSALGEGRKYNMLQGVERLQDVVIPEGETFSFNDYCAPYSAGNGYMEGPIINYVSDQKTGYGGGICQVSTTLYNVILQIPIKVVKEQPHSSYGIEYAPVDFDAAVGAGNIDLRLQNVLPYDVRMALHMTDGVITVMIYRADA